MIEDPWSLPELRPPGGGGAVVRLPELDTVRLTPAVTALIDHPHFQRLRRVRALGPTHLVYPGATHTRFEHSIGVYGAAVRYVGSLVGRESIRQSLGEVDVRTVLAAALLHDIGHYPFAHTLEALHGGGRDTPRHEDLMPPILEGRAPGLVRSSTTLARLLEDEMGVEPARVARLVTAPRAELDDPVDRFLQSIISSALDADKMDYLWRDSVHLGVPYGRNYDRDRLLGALTLGREGDSLAVTSKGLVSAEIFLFCRYTMFSEVYWHHTVRALSAMLDNAWADIVDRDRPALADLTSRLLGAGDDVLLESLAQEAPPGSVAARILREITGHRRRPYKRVITWSRVYGDVRKQEAYERIYGMDRSEVEATVATLRAALAPGPRPLPEGTVLLDVPPRDKDHLPEVQVHHPRAASWSRLSETSRIVAGIGEDFVKVVKKIRLFVHPDYAAPLGAEPERTEAIVHSVLGV